MTVSDARKMSRCLSPATGAPYGVQRVCTVWQMARSSFYANARDAADTVMDARPTRTRRRGSRPVITDEALAGYIRAASADSPFTGEGQRKIHPRITRAHGIHVGRDRVLRLMKDLHLLSPARVPATPAHAHDGTIVAATPNELWATDASACARTRMAGCGAVSSVRWNSACRGLHVRKEGTRFNALERLAHALMAIYRGTHRDVARGLALRMDHGSQFQSHHYQHQLR